MKIIIFTSCVNDKSLLLVLSTHSFAIAHFPHCKTVYYCYWTTNTIDCRFFVGDYFFLYEFVNMLQLKLLLLFFKDTVFDYETVNFKVKYKQCIITMPLSCKPSHTLTCKLVVCKQIMYTKHRYFLIFFLQNILVFFLMHILLKIWYRKLYIIFRNKIIIINDCVLYIYFFCKSL